MNLIGEIAGLAASFFFSITAIIYTNTGRAIGSQITNRIVKEVSALSRSGVSREQGLFIAEGIKVVKELLTSGLAIQMVVLQRGFETLRVCRRDGTELDEW